LDLLAVNLSTFGFAFANQKEAAIDRREIQLILSAYLSLASPKISVLYLAKM
jgi:hypothetical protein